MGKVSKKTGKGRLDKYYKLAKEQGYRARSAFKLIQLNKKFAFLESARCCIDLCAAPGGWLQVASKYMPANSIIVGVDLVPIKPIPRVVTLTSDITTPHCRNLIRGELKNWKADVILHDGAPNVGTAWIQDAYCQSELVVMSLRLAVEFLAKGGTFVTKVFRSVDYNNLLWVFSQLFGKVEATKPPSSRNVSAEIFVVCQDFLAPKYIDPKFLDPRHVFRDLAASQPSNGDNGIFSQNAEANVFQPAKKRRKRDGYDDNDYTLFKKISASMFVKGTDPISILGSVNKITFETEEEKEWLTKDISTSDILANFDDLKVLGKGDFKALLKWRLALRKEIGIDVRRDVTEEVVEITEDIDEEQKASEELEHLVAEAAARTKRARRRANEIKARTIQRMQLKMTAPLDIGLEQHDDSLDIGQDDIFSSNALKRKHAISTSEEEIFENDASESESEGDAAVNDEDECEERNEAGLEVELDDLYEAYQERLRARDAKYRARLARQDKSNRKEWSEVHGETLIDEGNDDGDGWGEERLQADEDSSSTESDGVDEESAPNPTLKRDTSRPEATAASRVWFNHSVFSGIEEHSSESGKECTQSNELDGDDTSGDQSEEPSSDDQHDDNCPEHQGDEDVEMQDAEDEHVNDIARAQMKKLELVTPESITLAQQLVNREKTKTQLINDGFNRYSLNSKEGLPSWFLDDESKHYKSNLPITKEAVAAFRAKQRAIDARPIKKVAEAKARKKFKAHQRLEKAIKTAEGVNATSDMSEREKARRIEKLMRGGRSSGQKTKPQVKLVVAKGSHRGIKGRPKGVKGRYVMVDSRMKKEVRAKKRREKAKKKRSV